MRRRTEQDPVTLGQRKRNNNDSKRIAQQNDDPIDHLASDNPVPATQQTPADTSHDTSSRGGQRHDMTPPRAAKKAKKAQTTTSTRARGSTRGGRRGRGGGRGGSTQNPAPTEDAASTPTPTPTATATPTTTATATPTPTATPEDPAAAARIRLGDALRDVMHTGGDFGDLASFFTGRQTAIGQRQHIQQHAPAQVGGTLPPMASITGNSQMPPNSVGGFGNPYVGAQHPPAQIQRQVPQQFHGHAQRQVPQHPLQVQQQQQQWRYDEEWAQRLEWLRQHNIAANQREWELHYQRYPPQ